MSKKKFKLTTTCLVTALHPNEPIANGTVWSPDNGADLIEAEALANIGYAKETNEKVTALTREQQAAGETLEAPRAPLTGIVDAELVELLKGNIATVTAALDDYTSDGLDRLAELEAAGAGRKGVLDAIEAAKAALKDEE